MSGIERDPLALCEPETDGRHFVAIKVGTGGHCTLAHRLVEEGPQPSGCVVWLVADCPLVVTPAEVLEVFAATAIWRPGCYRVRFAELAPGRLVRHPIEADPLAITEP